MARLPCHGVLAFSPKGIDDAAGDDGQEESSKPASQRIIAKIGHDPGQGDHGLLKDILRHLLGTPAIAGEVEDEGAVVAMKLVPCLGIPDVLQAQQKAFVCDVFHGWERGWRMVLVRRPGIFSGIMKSEDLQEYHFLVSLSDLKSATAN